MRYLLRLCLQGVMPQADGSILVFLFTLLAPANDFDEMRLNPQISSEPLAALKAHYDIDKPLAVRYVVWLKSLAHGEMGYSFAYNAPVAPLLAVRARNTLLLTIVSTVLAWCIALPLGVWSAEHSGRWVDRVVTGASAFLLVIPDIALGLGLLIFAVKTRWLPTGGMVSVGSEGMPFTAQLWDLLRHMALPVAILVLGAQPILVRHVRSAVAEALDEGFVRAAAAHGIPRRRLLWRYALRAAANPLISLFGFSIGAPLSGSLLVEVVTSWPGLGPFLLEAILARDLYVVIGGVPLLTGFLVARDFIWDLLFVLV